MQLRRKWILVGALLLAIAVAVLGGCGKPPADRAKVDSLVVNVIDIGQGDAILIRTPAGQVTLVDTGDTPAREKLVAYIKNLGITTIDNLVITHPHADHLGGAIAVLDNFTVKRVYDSGQVATSSLYRQYLSLIQKKNIPFAVVGAGKEIDIGGGSLKVLSPPTPFITSGDGELNNNSIVARLVYGNFAMLLSGDAEQEAEAIMVNKHAGELKSQVLKSGHHGSRTSSSLAFLKAVAPEAAIISLGAGNEYHHPHPSTLRRYSDLKLKVYRTDTDGTVTVTSDGKTYKISKEK